MYSNSPDSYHQLRMLNSSVKSSNFTLQSMEFKCHASTVSEYQLDMLQHLLEMESKTLPSLVLIEQQPEIKLGMRPLLLDFLMEVITILNLSKSTFPLTVNLIDRYCSTRIVKKQHYQLLGLTSLWISCKNLDSKFKIPSLNDLRKICVDSYYKELFIEMEKHILKSLEWMVSSPTFDSFVDLYLNILINNGTNPTVSNLIKKSCHKIKTLSNYIGELFQFYPNIYFDYTSSQIGLICILVSILTLKIPISLISLLNFYNDILKQDSDNETHEPILSVQSFQNLFNKNFFKNLIKILDNPPKCLEVKYFSEESKYSQLMKSLVECATDSLTSLLDPPVTPRMYGQQDQCARKQPTPSVLPLTPVSNSTSPKRFNDLIFSDEKAMVNPNTPSSRSSPVATMQPPSFKKRSFEDLNALDMIASYELETADDVKRSKTVARPVFFI
ncbi:uncharacterized protein CANTADRAFT_44580 [Suhomyces tanzawaensis NRRL Y-17324]|uniref:Cyclin-like domain-containing protein n=1 Tax=Suhomyces tanzawaensis NRRL Y-17324 TaxID=984487 RepID=A0A1E4SQ34_9ASCO|nr:uncharacterized protein CANTADRAFT_44580 [Suhomyces tanzawaensis NRRL Y-17324]ODV81608.1 hypothetical protein CANTADRAFT_44580 [Suhomyces tanzawaensis NRRL Y-17324]